uniref:OBG-type G domain-containing protein n=1 Tax=Rhabditophanes sp. KR3021 TaxID=114890 RepID=A0AC35U2C5_9BILA
MNFVKLILSRRTYSTAGFSKAPLFPRKATALTDASSFVDYKRTTCIGGNGGNGMVSFFKGYRVPFGGPDGGDGGNGAHVVFEADAHTKDLSNIAPIMKGKNGHFGMSKSCHGKSADHKIVKVPVHTVFRQQALDNYTPGKDIMELSKHGDIFIAARGGAGGHGNQFYVSNEVRKPIKAELGGEGEVLVYDIEMRVMAFAGFVGFPNAGKSSLLRAISRAKPKVASYPFTTLKPHIGMVEYDDFLQLSVADIPGLIEGAHKNVGLGVSFLQHIERCQCLVYVIDVSLGDSLVQFKLLKNELEMYKEGISNKPTIVVISKMDLAEDKNIKEIESIFDGIKVLPISSKRKTGLEDLLILLRDVYDQNEVK